MKKLQIDPRSATLKEGDQVVVTQRHLENGTSKEKRFSAVYLGTHQPSCYSITFFVFVLDNNRIKYLHPQEIREIEFTYALPDIHVSETKELAETT